MQAIEIETARLLLRPWRASDVDDAFSYGSDPEWARYLWEVPQPYLRTHAEQFVHFAAHNASGEQAHFAITLEGVAIGGVHLHTLDAANDVTGIGYNVARNHWGKGVATEAATAILEVAFRQFHVRKVIARADAKNVGSQRVLEKLGMNREAV